MKTTLSLTLAALGACALLFPSDAPGQDTTYDIAKLAAHFRDHGKVGTSGQELFSNKVVVDGQLAEQQSFNRISKKTSDDALEMRYLEFHEAGTRNTLEPELKGTLTRADKVWTWKATQGTAPEALAKMIKIMLKERNDGTSLAGTVFALAPKKALKIGETWSAEVAAAAKALELPFKNPDPKASSVKGTLKALDQRWIDLEIKATIVYPERNLTITLAITAKLPTGPHVTGHVEGTATMDMPGRKLHVVQRFERSTVK